MTTTKHTILAASCLFIFTASTSTEKPLRSFSIFSSGQSVFEIGGVQFDQLAHSTKAFLDTLAAAEGTIETKTPCIKDSGYSALVGCNISPKRLAESYDSHPKSRKKIRKNLSSDAAGRYQILSRTWNWAAPKAGATDFSPRSQDKVAVWLLENRGALKHIRKIGPADYQVFKMALRLSNKEWASLPGSPYGQRTHTKEYLWKIYKEAFKTYSL
jgi:muramidase (phage lysozyme)